MNVLEFLNKKKPASLYHYTNLNAFVSIVQNEELWLSDLWFLNDKNEYLEGLSIIKDILEVKKVEFINDKKVSVFLKLLNKAIPFLRERPVYILSLTPNNDLLSQWRAYGKNGVCIELDLISYDKFKLFPCIYKHEHQVEYITNIFGESIELFLNTKENGKYPKEWCIDNEELPFWDALNTAVSDFISKCNVACALIKNSGFSEEEEWRFISFSSDNIHFVAMENFIKPFEKVKLNSIEKTLKEVKIGQNVDVEQCYKSIEYFLKAKKVNENKSLIDYVKISKSIIPYRI